MSAPHRGRADQRLVRTISRMALGYALRFLAKVAESIAIAATDAGIALTKRP